MTIQLPIELENSIQAAVQAGQFASIDDAMAEAARRLLRDLGRVQASDASEPRPDPILGCMRDEAEMMDEIAADAYRQRSDVSWREVDL